MRPVGEKVVALGNFDGVHLGHRKVLERAIAEGGRREVSVVAATFDPHPRSVLRPENAPKLLSSLAVRRDLLLGAGVDEVAVITFDDELSRKSPEEFVEGVLIEELGAGCVIVGENFRFGHRASGSLEDMARIMRSCGGDAIGVSVRGANGEETISSTRIRTLLENGEVEGAAALLGRPYVLPGEIVVGDRRGRTIGFPTANLASDPRLVVPAQGVYACRAKLDDETFGACVNIGVAPTFGERERRVEAHILDFDEDVYGREMELEFIARVRGEKRFDGVDELVEQIRSDVASAREILAGG